MQKLFCNNDGTAVFYFLVMQADAPSVRELIDGDKKKERGFDGGYNA